MLEKAPQFILFSLMSNKVNQKELYYRLKQWFWSCSVNGGYQTVICAERHNEAMNLHIYKK